MKVYFRDYMKLAEGGDMTLPAAEALRALGDGDTLVLPRETLDFYPERALHREYYISNNSYSDKAIAFPLIGRKDITIDGGGADLIFHGNISPFVVDGSSGITIKNLSVDYRYPFYAQGLIVASEDKYFDVEFDREEFFCRAAEGGLLFSGGEPAEWTTETNSVLVTEFDGGTRAPSAYKPPYIAKFGPYEKSFLSGMFRSFRAEQLSESRVRMHAELGYRHTVGNWWICTHSGRKHPGFFITESRDTVLEDIDMFHTAAMGVIAQTSENVTLTRVNAIPRPGSKRLLSVKADATHFVNCSGRVTLKDCKFVNMLDDASNIHGIYAKADRKISDNALYTSFGHAEQAGIKLFFPGDAIRFVDNKTMRPYAYLTVRSCERVSGSYLRLETVEPLPEGLAPGHVVENFSRMPELVVDGCECGNNRPRGILVSTCKKAVIENSLFYDMSCALHFTGDANSWYESGPVADVTVRNNRFVNSAYCGGAVIVLGLNIPEYVGEGYHSGVTITDNLFQLHEKRFLSASCSDRIVFKNNTYVEDDSLPKHSPISETGIRLDRCRGCEIEEPVKK